MATSNVCGHLVLATSAVVASEVALNAVTYPDEDPPTGYMVETLSGADTLLLRVRS